MATTDVGLHEAAGRDARVPVVNNMSIQVATVNGSGSQSSNTVLLRSIFQMGVPVSGKNLFPSNIAGLPTWYTIRANKDGYVARKKEIDFLIAMNAETARDDVMSLDPGAAVLYDEPLKLSSLRDDLIFYSVPYDKLVATVCPEAKLRKLVKNMIEYLKRFRIGADGKATFAVVQAEDELAAIGMVIGAGWAGARAMTTTSGPGISLMSEFAGLSYYAEIPAVVWDIQRVGPSTGLPTRTSQSDILSTAFLSHGDTKHIMLFPSSPHECFEMAMEAFNLAEKFQTLVFVMSDLDLGMNNWMSDPFPYPEKPIERGKVLTKEDLEKLGSFSRYKDVDGDAIGYRTLPGTQHPAAAYFTRGSGHNAQAQYSERPEDYESNMDRLRRKFEHARSSVPAPVVQTAPNAEIGIIGFGSSHWALTESRDQLRDEHNLASDYLRIRAFPYAPEVADFVRAHKRIYVVEQNRDSQMFSLLKLELDGDLVPKLRSVARLDGLPL